MSKNEECMVCRQSASKYKCPVCLVKYCSVACYKGHKEQGNCLKKVPEEKITPPSAKEESKDELTYQYETEDTVPPEKLALLGCDPFILNCLRNPHLRDMLIHLNSTPDPYNALADAMREPIFEEFATRCLDIVQENPDMET